MQLHAITCPQCHAYLIPSPHDKIHHADCLRGALCSAILETSQHSINCAATPKVHVPYGSQRCSVPTFTHGTSPHLQLTQ